MFVALRSRKLCYQCRCRSKKTPTSEYPPEKELDGEERKVSGSSTSDPRFRTSEMNGTQLEMELVGKDARFEKVEWEVEDVACELP